MARSSRFWGLTDLARQRHSTAIAGLVTPEGGSVTIDGQDVTTMPMYRRAQLGIGYLPQEMSIFRGLSVQDNIRAILDITEKYRPQAP